MQIRKQAIIKIKNREEEYAIIKYERIENESRQ